jgi:hypothetical protein
LVKKEQSVADTFHKFVKVKANKHVIEFVDFALNGQDRDAAVDHYRDRLLPIIFLCMHKFLFGLLLVIFRMPSFVGICPLGRIRAKYLKQRVRVFPKKVGIPSKKKTVTFSLMHSKWLRQAL